MTISSTTVKNSYLGNGTLDTFNYTFKIFADSDLQVIIRDASATETVKTLTTHYTVTGAGSASGGTIVFTAGNIPTSTETVVIRRAVPQTQAIDYIANDPFPAESHEEGLDRAMMAVQQLQEEVNRSIKLSRTNTMNSTEFAVGSADRVNKIFGFDSNGELVVTQELGTFRGNWSSATTFAVRDIIKDTSNNNIYICLTAHTSSGTQPISTNTDSAKWGLLVDAASATTSAINAAASATAAATSASNAATSATNAATSETNAATSATNAATSETNAASSASAASTSASNASTSATNAATSETNAATSETAAASSATSAASSATTATTQASAASTSATNAATSETNAATSETNAATSATNASASETAAATSETNAATSETNAATSETNAANSATSASNSATTVENIFDNFDDRFLGTKASDPTLDNDGNALSVGAVYYNSTANEVRFYNGSTWDAPSASAATSATNAANSASAAATSESNAATSASTASTQATNSANSATAAQTAQTAAETALDTFDDRFLGAKSSDPTLDNDGNALIDGALYWNTSDNVFKVYDLGNTQWNRTIPTASDQTKINTVSNDLSGSNTIGTVATNIANVNDVASNITGVNSFAERYRVVSSDPTTSLDAGDLAFNTTGSAFKYYDGSSWQVITAGGITDVVQDSTPELGGTLGLNSNDITGTGNINITGDVTATNIAGSGASLTSLNASNLSSGTVAEARLPASALGSIWESKNSSFTAEARKNYFVDTSSAALTATLPSSPSIGDEIRFLDVTATFDTNNLTIARNGNPIQGDASDLTINTERAGFSLVFYNGTQGWLLTEK